MTAVKKTIKIAEELFIENAQTRENPDGLLRNDQSKYLACLKVKHADLENLLSQDEAYWAKN